VSLVEPQLAPPLTQADAWDQAASRVTPLGEYLGAKFTGGGLATVPGQVLRQARLPAPAGYPTDEMRVFGPSEPVDVGSPRLDEEGWKQSPHYRPGVPWDEGMTEARAEGLARIFDADTWRDSLVERYQGGAGGQVLGFLAAAAPGLADPTNFVPLVGPGARAAALARFGRIAGGGLAAGVDAAAGTLLFEPLTVASARQEGRDFGLGDAAADLALGAAVGALFGTVHGAAEGVLARRRAAQKLRPDGLVRTLDALDAVNEALARGREADVAPILRTEPAYRRGLLAGTALGTAPTFEAPGLARGEPRPGAPTPEWRVTVEPDGHVDVQPRRPEEVVPRRPGEPVVEGERRRVTPAEVQRELGVGYNEAFRIAGERNRAAAEAAAPSPREGEPGADVVPRRPGEPAGIAETGAGAGVVPLRPGETPGRVDFPRAPGEPAVAGGSVRGPPPGTPPSGTVAPAPLLPRAPVERTIGDVVSAQVAREREARALVLTAATPRPPHPSVAEAAPRVGKEADERQTFLEDAGLAGDDRPLPVEGAAPAPPPGRAVGLEVANLLRGAGRPEAEIGPSSALVQAFFETMAKRAGVDPAELFGRYKLAVRGGVTVEEGRALGMLAQSAALRTGEEDLRAFGIEPGKVYGTREIATAFEARTAAKYGRIARTDVSPEAQARIARWMADEVRYELDPTRAKRNGASWYSEKFQGALDRYGELFPELVDDAAAADGPPGTRRLGTKKNARDFFTAIIAVTSDGQKAADNFRQATRIYDHFRRTGDLPKVTFGADRNTSINANLRNIMRELEDHGPEGMHRGLMQEATVSELARMAKERGISFGVKYPADTRLPLAAIVFGPKLGAFYANLMGSHGYLTMDRWWSRTFNRYRGQLLTKVSGTADRPTDARGNPIGLARYKQLVGHPGLSDEQALELVAVDRRAYEARGFKHGPDVPGDVVEREKAANTLYKNAFLGLEDMPFTTADRGFMIRTVNEAREALARAGHDLSVADIQAILWYYEKRLYAEMGARSTADESYLDIADRLVAAEGRGPGVGEGADLQGAAGDVVHGAAGGAREGEGGFGSSPDHERGVPARLGQDVGGKPKLLFQVTAFHGSPYVFDRFSLKHIGTGEGAQAYGHGLYFAEREGVARGYRDTLAEERTTVGGEPFDSGDPGHIAAGYLAMHHGDRQAALATLRSDVAEVLADRSLYEPREVDAYVAAPALLEGGAPLPEVKAGGALYRVELDVEHADLLDWDKPLGGQDPEVRERLEALASRLEADDPGSYAARDVRSGKASGATFYHNLTTDLSQGLAKSDPALASAALREAGIPGNRYLDAGSRAPGEGTRNIVMYDDSKIKITHRDGEPVAAGERARVLQQMTGEQAQEPPRGVIGFYEDGNTLIALFKDADASTFLHESGHLFFKVLQDLAPHVPEAAADWRAVESWLGLKPGEALSIAHEERLAAAFEAYLREGEAPTPGLKGAFEAFKDWLTRIYQSLLQLGGRPSAEIRAVFDRILGGGEAPTPEAKAKPAADLPPELQDVEAMRRGGDLLPEDQLTLAAGEAAARTHEAWADAYQTLAGCVLREAA
jgi:hypothetical protein